MRAYLAVARARLAALVQYRAAALAGLTTQVFWGFIKVMVLTAFYASAVSATPISLAQAITFIWLGQALLQLVPWNIDKEIEAQVSNGNVAYELVRPVDLYWLWFSRCLAIRVVPTLMRALPLVALAGLFFGLEAPVSLSAGIWFGVSLLFSALLAAALTAMAMITLFWTISGEGLLRLLPHVAMLLSGLVVPLPLFPDWMQPILSLQPFRGVIDIPIRLYTGVIPVSEAVYYLSFQTVWSLLLILAGRGYMRMALKKLVIQGG